MAKRKSTPTHKTPHIRATEIATRFRSHMGNVSTLASMFVLVDFEGGKVAPAVLRNWFSMIKQDADGAVESGTALIDLVHAYEWKAGK